LKKEGKGLRAQSALACPLIRQKSKKTEILPDANFTKQFETHPKISSLGQSNDLITLRIMVLAMAGKIAPPLEAPQILVGKPAARTGTDNVEIKIDQMRGVFDAMRVMTGCAR
jgi:hypothetical protein